MEFIEYSLESYRDESLRLAVLVDRSGYRPDCVAYLATGAWQIGQVCAEHFDIPIIELSAHRSGDQVKKQAHSLLALLPRFLKRLARRIEITNRLKNDSGLEQKNTMHVTNRFPLPSGIKNILLVDDSADTGTSVRLGVELLSDLLPTAKVKVAVINSFAPARETGLIDWSLREDCLLSTPMSKDNKSYQQACIAYDALGELSIRFGQHEGLDNV